MRMRKKFGEIKANEEVEVGEIPAGVIVLWSGVKPPEGWAVCDGKRGTPELAVIPAKAKTVVYIQKL